MTNKTMIPGKDLALEETIEIMGAKLKALGINIVITSWLNPLPHVWSVHIKDSDSPMCFTNGKGSSKNAALASAYGEYFERISCNYFYADWYFGENIAESEFVHYPNEKWFKFENDSIPAGLLDQYLLNIYNPNDELVSSDLVDTNSGNSERGICALPFVRQSDDKEIFIPMSVIGNLYVSNGMSAGNTKFEARVQCLSEIFERYTKNKIIMEQISLPEIPKEVLAKYPTIVEGIEKLEEAGFPILVKDASLGGKFPVINVTLLNPENGGVFASFGAHPRIEVAIERTLTELLQGRSLETLDVVQAPSFNEYAVCNHDNIEDHFIDSTGVISWKFFSDKPDYEFVNWGTQETSTQEEYNHLMDIFKQMEKEVYIADYNHLGVNACRILVPTVSEIYSSEDLVCDNNNRSIDFREDILNIHRLDNSKLEALLTRLEESELDDFMPITELIGVVFDQGTHWSQLTIGELKLHTALAVKDFDMAKHLAEIIVTFGGKTKELMGFYRALDSILDTKIDATLNLIDYKQNFEKLYTVKVVTNVLSVIDGDQKFIGLEETDSNLKGLKTHAKLIESFNKLRIKMKS